MNWTFKTFGSTNCMSKMSKLPLQMIGHHCHSLSGLKCAPYSVDCYQTNISFNQCTMNGDLYDD